MAPNKTVMTYSLRSASEFLYKMLAGIVRILTTAFIFLLRVVTQ